MGPLDGPRGLALCAGAGGLELGLERLLREYRTVCYVEGETYAASILASRMEEGRLHPAPIWSNVRTFDPEPWVGVVDCLSGGFPCQPFSQAGAQKGEDDPRHLWPDFVRIIRVLRPRFLFLENVPGVVKHAGSSVAEDLAKLGYDFSWTLLRASDVGAPHQRRRWFCFAEHPNPHGSRFKGLRTEDRFFGGLEEGQLERGRAGRFRENVPHTHGDRQSIEPFNAQQRGFIQQLFSNTDGFYEQRLQPRLFDSKGREGPFKGPFRPLHDEQRGPWEVEPGVGRVVDGVAYWVDRMRALGNGVVPQQAEAAYRYLMNRMGIE